MYLLFELHTPCIAINIHLEVLLLELHCPFLELQLLDTFFTNINTSIIRPWNIFVVLIIFCRTSWICILVTGKKSCGIDMVYCWFSTELNHLRKSFCFEYKKIEGYDQMMQIITDIIKHTVCQQYLEWMSWFKCQSLSFWYFWPWHKNEIVYICYLFVIDIWTKKLLMCGNMTRSMAQA